MLTKTRATLLFAAIVIPAGMLAQAKVTSKKVEKVAAPGMEEYAAFFSKGQNGISPEALKQADDLRLKTIDSINSLLDSPKLAAIRKFELLLRLGETYVERHDYLRGREINHFASVNDSWEKAGRKGKPPEINHSASRQELTKAVNSFRKLVTEFPKHDRTDSALFALAQTLSRLGNDNSTMYYNKLLKTYPNSPLVPETHLALAETYFERHQIANAIDSYKDAMKYKENKAYPYAVYKLGWAHYNANARNNSEQQENYKKSIAAFKLVIKLADLPQYHQGAVSLKDEAVKDLIVVWADAADVDSAWAYFQSIGATDMFYKMLERLGYIYVDQGKNKDAIKVFTRLLKESPLRESNPSVHGTLAELYDLTGSPSMTVDTLRAMQKTYIGQTAWTKARSTTGAESNILAEAKERIRKDIHRFGASYHEHGQKTRSQEHLQAASALYKSYLETFAETEPAYEIRYYLAEILFGFKAYEEATAHYLIVSNQKQEKYRHDAAKSAVEAMHNVVNSGKFAKLPERGHVASPMAIPSQKVKLVEAIDNFIKLLPKDNAVGAMKFTAADILFDYGHYQKSMERFADITKALPGSKQSDAAVKLIVAYQLDKELWSGAIDWSKRFLKQDGLLNAKLEDFVRASLRTALFKHGLALEKLNKRKDAAKAFMDFQREFPNDATADKALYNASINYYKLGELDEALAAGQLLLERYPKSEIRADVMLTVGQTYESTADFVNAANFYIKYANDFPKDKRAPGVLFNGAILQKGLHKLDDAEKSFKQFIRLYPSDQYATDALIELAEVQEIAGRHKEAIVSYEDFAKRTGNKDIDRSTYATAKAAVLNARSGNPADGRKNLEKLAETLTKSSVIKAYDARRLLAKGLFEIYNQDMKEYSTITLDDGGKIESQVSRKNSKLMDLAKKYQTIISLGDAEHTVACLYRLGELHEELADALFKVPAPAGSSQADIDKFRSQLEKVAFPLRDDANKYFETAFDRSKEVDTFTEWTKRIQDKMAELQPQKYKRFEAETVKPRYLSHKLQLTESTRDLAN